MEVAQKLPRPINSFDREVAKGKAKPRCQRKRASTRRPSSKVQRRRFSGSDTFACSRRAQREQLGNNNDCEPLYCRGLILGVSCPRPSHVSGPRMLAAGPVHTYGFEPPRQYWAILRHARAVIAPLQLKIQPFSVHVISIKT